MIICILTTININTILTVTLLIILLLGFINMAYYFFKSEFTDPGRYPYDKCFNNENKISKKPIEIIYLNEIK